MSLLRAPRAGPRLPVAAPADAPGTGRAPREPRRRTLTRLRALRLPRPSAITLATIFTTPILVALVVLDVADGSISRWLTDHAFTTDALVAVLVLLITVLNVDRIARRRQVRDRALATAAQAAILGRQAQRATDQVRAADTDRCQRDDASDELRTYLSMLLVSAPVLIDAPSARTFLENAQRLGGLLAYGLAHADDDSVSRVGPRLDAAVAALNASAQPLLAILNHSQRRAVDAAADDAPPDDA